MRLCQMQKPELAVGDREHLCWQVQPERGNALSRLLMLTNAFLSKKGTRKLRLNPSLSKTI